ncbi:MAG: pilus assembly protein PilP [Candidatus Binatia bacterium]
MSKVLVGAVVVVLSWGSGFGVIAQENVQTPSQKTTEAVEKLIKTPATIGKSLGAMTEAAKVKLQQVLGEKPEIKTKAEPDDISVPPRKTIGPESPRYAPKGKRDPFRPLNLPAKTSPRVRDNLSPLERFELGQLKVVGIVWDIQEPIAMIEDRAGLGYTVSTGMLIGRNEGKVKAIHRNQVVVQESFEDFSGRKKTRDVVMKLSVE